MVSDHPWVEAIASRVEAIAGRLEAIASRVETFCMHRWALWIHLFASSNDLQPNSHSLPLVVPNEWVDPFDDFC